LVRHARVLLILFFLTGIIASPPRLSRIPIAGAAPLSATALLDASFLLLSVA